MPWGSGTFSRFYGSTGWADDKNASTFILSSRHDTHDQDLAEGINACITRDNQAKPTAHFLPNATNTLDLGSASFTWRNIFGFLDSLFVKYAQTPAEQAASVTPTNLWYDITDYGNAYRYNAKGDGTTDDTTALQNWINVGLRGCPLFLPRHISGNGFKITSSLIIPNTSFQASNLIITGDPSAIIYNTVNDYAITIGDNVTTNVRSFRLYFKQFQIVGTGGTDNTKPNQGGIKATAILDMDLEDIYIVAVAGNPICFNKSQAASSAYLNMVSLTRCNFRVFGGQVLVGNVYAADDFCMYRTLINNGGELATPATNDGVCHIEAQTLTITGGEISTNANHKYALYMRKASGSINGLHFENNTNNVAGSSDIFADTDCNGLEFHGTNHQCTLATSAKCAIKTTSANNVISCPTVDTGPAHTVDTIVDVTGAKNAKVIMPGLDSGDDAYPPNNAWVTWSNPSELASGTWQGQMKHPSSYIANNYSVAAASVNTGNGNITITGHAFVEGDNLYIAAIATPPAGLLAAYNYYVHVIDANTIRLRVNEGAADIVPSTQGTGPFTFNRVAFASTYTLYWNTQADAYIHVPIKLCSNSFTAALPRAIISAANAAAGTAIGSTKSPYFVGASYNTNTGAFHFATADASSITASSIFNVQLDVA